MSLDKLIKGARYLNIAFTIRKLQKYKMVEYRPLPILFHVGSFNVYTFGVAVVIAILTALFLILKKAKKAGIDEEHICNLILFIIIGSVIGSRLFYFLMNMQEFSSIFDIFAIWRGGFLGIGTLIGGLLAALIYTKKAKLDFANVMDLIAPYIALAFAIGRIGCFLRGCCFGLPTTLPWGIVYSENSLAGAAGLAGVPLHPTQLYLVLTNFIIFLILLRMNTKKLKNKQGKPKGHTFLLFLVLFSLQRILVDFVRYYPERYFISSFTIFQLAYASIFIFAFVLLLRQKSNTRFK